MPPTTSAPAFELTCHCGAKLRGQRETRHQVVQCPQCRAERFVLPLSPLPEVKPAASPAARRRSLWPWFLAGGAAIGLLAVLVLVVVLMRTDKLGTVPSEGPPTDARLQTHLREGHAALGEGAYLRAAREFDRAIQISERLGRPPAERKPLQQLQRQSALLGDLLAESLAEVIRHAVGLPEVEWQEIVRRRYAGRSFVLDDTISRGPDGRYHHGFKIAAPGGEARIGLGRLRVLHDLPLVQPQRMLLGMRLAELRRDASGWTIEPDADSGVLLTDAEVFAGLSLPLDAELREVLKRQRGWLSP